MLPRPVPNSTKNKKGENQGTSRKVPRIKERDVLTEQAQQVPAWGQKRTCDLPNAAHTDPPTCAKKQTPAQDGRLLSGNMAPRS